MLNLNLNRYSMVETVETFKLTTRKEGSNFSTFLSYVVTGFRFPDVLSWIKQEKGFKGQL